VAAFGPISYKLLAQESGSMIAATINACADGYNSSKVAEMHDILDDPTDEEEDHPTPESDPSSTNARPNHQAFMFGYSSTMLTLRISHPPKSQIPLYWELYMENVNPLIRLLHGPTTGKLLMKAAENLDNLSKGTEALVFAIYLATVTSASPEQCQSLLQQDKDIAIQRYRFATEQALARASFLQTQEVIVLQAFTLFLISARRHDDSRFVWTMTGLATRIANALGIHRDGAQFGLSPFETEMRRRLWWQVCTLGKSKVLPSLWRVWPAHRGYSRYSSVGRPELRPYHYGAEF